MLQGIDVCYTNLAHIFFAHFSMSSIYRHIWETLMCAYHWWLCRSCSILLQNIFTYIMFCIEGFFSSTVIVYRGYAWRWIGWFFQFFGGIFRIIFAVQFACWERSFLENHRKSTWRWLFLSSVYSSPTTKYC